MNVDILYFEGCPNHEPAVALARRVIADLGVEADLRQIEVDSPQAARDLKFLGSPSIRVDGVDVDPDAADADERGEYAMSCRVYGGAGLPPREWIENAIQGLAPGAAPAAAMTIGVASKRANLGFWAGTGALLSAATASACCWVPLALLGLGASSAGVSAFFEPLRPYFLGATGLLLTGAFYFVYFRKPACEPGSACQSAPPPVAGRFTRASLWLSTVGVVAFALFPSYVDLLSPADAFEGVSVDAAPAQAAADRVALQVEGMTCAACAVTVETALAKLPGVAGASIDFKSGRGILKIDPDSPPTDETLISTVADLGFEAEMLVP